MAYTRNSGKDRTRSEAFQRYPELNSLIRIPALAGMSHFKNSGMM
jgi:hypothetical protein